VLSLKLARRVRTAPSACRFEWLQCGVQRAEETTNWSAGIGHEPTLTFAARPAASGHADIRSSLAMNVSYRRGLTLSLAVTSCPPLKCRSAKSTIDAS